MSEQITEAVFWVFSQHLYKQCNGNFEDIETLLRIYKVPDREKALGCIKLCTTHDHVYLNEHMMLRVLKDAGFPMSMIAKASHQQMWALYKRYKRWPNIPIPPVFFRDEIHMVMIRTILAFIKFNEVGGLLSDYVDRKRRGAI